MTGRAAEGKPNGLRKDERDAGTPGPVPLRSGRRPSALGHQGPGHSRGGGVLGSIPGLYPMDDRSTPSRDNHKHPQTSPSVPSGAASPPREPLSRQTVPQARLRDVHTGVYLQAKRWLIHTEERHTAVRDSQTQWIRRVSHTSRGTRTMSEDGRCSEPPGPQTGRGRELGREGHADPRPVGRFWRDAEELRSRQDAPDRSWGAGGGGRVRPRRKAVADVARTLMPGGILMLLLAGPDGAEVGSPAAAPHAPLVGFPATMLPPRSPSLDLPGCSRAWAPCLRGQGCRGGPHGAGGVAEARKARLGWPGAPPPGWNSQAGLAAS